MCDKFTNSLIYLYELDLKFFQKSFLNSFIKTLTIQVGIEIREEVANIKKEESNKKRQEEKRDRKIHFDNIKDYEKAFNQIKVEKTILEKIKEKISKSKKNSKKKGLLSIFELDVLEGGLSKVSEKENEELA